MRAQRGLSIVELMVALTLSTFLILAVTQLYLNNKRHALFQEGQVSNDENGRTALLLLDQQLARAGFRANPTLQTTLETAFAARPAANGCPAMSRGQAITLTDDKTGVCLRYQGETRGRDSDCLGNPIAEATNGNGTEVLTRISYVADPVGAVGRGNLQCSAQGQPAQVIVAGLADFVWFKLPTPSQASQAVRYAALFSSRAVPTEGMANAMAANWKPLTGREPPAGASTQVLQIVQGSVTLRNLMP
ncbi:PilW family protein [Pseudomonas oryzihabitans]|uniref:PilW family protein n=1 Tax=Pseudomonas oryzihabitans TaxID=47885 RepID=UPI00135DE84E|nr:MULTISPECIES: prepilin-type N-terminal cleavage/methylation domain-containing protein [Pseudomonas]MXS17457.1 pilus assembly protein PilW [Pseudomonas oryzihabitans]UUW71447.1 prepilin-type N-terminal cleavage/methylation domain-containing protein [Pseudomonas psychrotolerans]